MNFPRKRIALLGSTGSIGTSTIRVIRACPEQFELTVIAAGSNVKKLAEQAAEFHPKYAVVSDESKFQELKELLPAGTIPLAGPDALCSLMSGDAFDMVLVAIVGTGGLKPTMEAIRAKKQIALASKEVMVMAGSLVMDLAKKNQVKILPVDSEHNAIFQCLEGHDPEDVGELILTASGGPFRKYTKEQMERVTLQDALKHPTWSMGPKVTVDSASLMNKALEMIEARWLFGVTEERIRVIIHPQSIVHSMVRFKDGGMLAQMNVADMRFPIQYAMSWPHRLDGGLPELDLTKTGALEFEEPDPEGFPALDLARRALRDGGSMPAVLNAANEVAFRRFCAGEIRFTDIWKVVEFTMSKMTGCGASDLKEIFDSDRHARSIAESWR